MLRRQQVVVVQEADAVARRRVDAGLRGRGAPPVRLVLDAAQCEGQVVPNFGAAAAVVHQHDLDVPVRPAGQAVERLGQPARPVVRPHHDGDAARRIHLEQRRNASQVGDELRRAPGREVAGPQLAVALRGPALARQAVGAEAAQAEAGVEVVVALLLAPVVGHRGGDPVHLGRDVDQQIRVEGVVHLVAEDAKQQVPGRRVVLGGRRIAPVRSSPAASDQSLVQGAEGGLVVRRDLERRRDEHQVRTAGVEQRLDLPGQFVQREREGAVLKAAPVAHVLHPADAEGCRGRLRLRAPQRRVVPTAHPFRRSLAASRAVAQKGADDVRAARGQLQEQPAAAEHLVVVVGGQDENPPGDHRARHGRRLRSFASRHGADPRTSVFWLNRRRLSARRAQRAGAHPSVGARAFRPAWGEAPGNSAAGRRTATS